VAEEFVGCADRDNLAVRDEYTTVFDYSEVAHSRPTARSRATRIAAQRQQLRRVGEEPRA
jgi:hypothetical protein